MTSLYLRMNAIDPTKTSVLRKAYERDLVNRFQALKKLVRATILDSDLSLNARFSFGTSGDKVGQFMDWIKRQERSGILEVRDGISMVAAARTAWQNKYLRSAYQKGISRAASQVRKAGATVDSSFVAQAFARPIHADRIGIVYTRAYSELQGITDAMDKKISRVLAQAMLEGRAPREIASLIEDAIDTIGIVRARTLARTETINAHADATLNTYEEAGVKGVEAEAEFATAQDNRVCPQCEALQGQVFTLEEARGVIPVHPNCRCAWLPVIRDAKGKILK